MQMRTLDDYLATHKLEPCPVCQKGDTKELYFDDGVSLENMPEIGRRKNKDD